MAVSEKNSLNILHNMIGDQPTMSMQKRKVIRPVHTKGAKKVNVARTPKASRALHQEYQTPRRLVMAMDDIVSMSAKLNARKRLRNTVDDHFSADKKQTLAEEQSMQVTASIQYHLVEAVMFACESYLKDCTGFEGFILWALVDSNGYFEQPDRIEEPEGMERNDESFKFANEAATSVDSYGCFEPLDGIEEPEGNGCFEECDGIEEPESMERNDESFKSANKTATLVESDRGCFEQPDGEDEPEMVDSDSCCFEQHDGKDEPEGKGCFEQPDGIDEPDGLESNDESFKFVNEAAEPVHLKSAESVRPVYIRRPWHASHHNAESVRPVYIKRPWHTSHHKGHTTLRSSDRWANNWPKQDKEQCCIKSYLTQKYITPKCKYPTSGWRKCARSEETTWTSPSTITLKSRPIRCFHGC